MTTCAVVVYGPDFAGSENLVPALGQKYETKLICLKPSDWRQYDEGILMTTAEGIQEARAFIETADIIFLGDATSINALSIAAPDDEWICWARRKNNIIVYFGDSAYHNHHRLYDGILAELNIKRLFLLPNLIPLTNMDAVPLHHPVPVAETPKADKLTVMHAPGRDGRAIVKGTGEIEATVKKLQDDKLDFDYVRLSYLTLANCLTQKATAHIVIDQLPQDGLIHGMGRVGTEALGCGSAVLSKMYDTAVLKGFFVAPPVVNVQNQAELEDKLRGLLSDGELLKTVQAASLEWAAENVAYDKWLSYVERYL